MGYIGVQPEAGFTSGLLDRFTSTTGTTVTLTHDISSENDIIVFVNFVKQDSTNYSVGGSGNKTLTLGGTLVSSDIVEVHYLNIVKLTQQPSANSVGVTELNVSEGTSGQALTTNGSGTLSFSTVGGDNTPAFSVYRNSEQTGLSNDTFTKVQFNAESFDTDNAFDSSSNYRFTVPSGEGGKYQFNTALRFIDASSSNSVRDTLGVAFYVNGSSVAHLKQNYEAGINQGGIAISHILSLSASDYVEVYAFHEHGSGTAKINGTGSEQLSWFSGFKLLGV